MVTVNLGLFVHLPNLKIIYFDENRLETLCIELKMTE